MAQISHSPFAKFGGKRPRKRPHGVPPMEYPIQGDTRPAKPWTDPRRPGIDYTYRFDVPEQRYSWNQLRIRSLTIQKVTKYKSILRHPLTTLTTEDNANKRRIRISSNIVDYLGGFLGFRVRTYRLNYNNIGGINPFSSAIHDTRDFEILVEDFYHYRMVEFVVAHEIGHYVLHAGGGRRPCCWPRVSSSVHDAEATVFAAYFVFPPKEVEKIRTLVKGNVRDGAYIISQIFQWSRYVPDTGIPPPKKKKRKPQKNPYRNRTGLTEHQRRVKAMEKRQKFEDD